MVLFFRKKNGAGRNKGLIYNVNIRKPRAREYKNGNTGRGGCFPSITHRGRAAFSLSLSRGFPLFILSAAAHKSGALRVSFPLRVLVLS
jgi:hypothetical protein